MKQIALTATVLTAAEAASAQSNVTMYGNIDQYVNDMTSSSGAKVKSLKDGACLRSHVGRRGTEDLGDGLQAKFQLEGGLSTDTGRFFDRQSWVGIADQYGEARVGRQNGPMFARGGNIDDTTRTLRLDDQQLRRALALRQQRRLPPGWFGWPEDLLHQPCRHQRPHHQRRAVRHRPPLLMPLRP
jgi:predicted porin